MEGGKASVSGLARLLLRFPSTDLPTAVPEADFFDRVYAIVAQIPPGRVTTYGRIARHLGIGRGARAVGWALKAVARSSDPLALPCHRVVNREGALTGRMHFETPDVMEERLRSEGVSFDEEGRVVMDDHVWGPAG